MVVGVIEGSKAYDKTTPISSYLKATAEAVMPI